MRTVAIQHRSQFLRGTIPGLALVAIKFMFFSPVNITDLLYGLALLLTLIITTGELLEFKRFILEAKVLDFVAGFLFPLDCYAILILFGLPLTN